MKIVGLTGGIGMGKSTAAAAFRRAGVPVFDADATVHALQRPHGRALAAIEQTFPGTVHGRHAQPRRAARKGARGPGRDAPARTHPAPLVRQAQRRFLARARGSSAPFVVLDIPLLFESGGYRGVDHIVVVSAPGKVQLARVRARRRMPDSEIDRHDRAANAGRGQAPACGYGHQDGTFALPCGAGDQEVRRRTEGQGLCPGPRWGRRPQTPFIKKVR